MGGIGLTALLAGASVPFAAGTTLELMDKIGLDATGAGYRARNRINEEANTAGWANLFGVEEKGFADDLGVAAGSMENLGPAQRALPMGPSSEVDSFLQQLFAKEGMRLQNLGQEAQQMSFMGTALRGGLV